MNSLLSYEVELFDIMNRCIRNIHILSQIIYYSIALVIPNAFTHNHIISFKQYILQFLFHTIQFKLYYQQSH